MDIQEIKQVRIEKLSHLLSKGLKPYGQRFETTHAIGQVIADFKEEAEVALAGRVLANRKHGKVLFMDLRDQTGKIQLFIKADYVGADKFAIVQDLDIGDIIGASGNLLRTKSLT